MRELRHVLNSAGPVALRELAAWFRKQAQSCDTLADYADWERRRSADTARIVALCRAGRFDQAEALGAPAAMLAAWKAVSRTAERRSQIHRRKEQARLLAGAGLTQRAIAAHLRLSLGRVNQLLRDRADDRSPRMLPREDRP